MLEFEKMLITKYSMLKVKNIEYYHYYSSSDGNNAYYTKANLGSKRFYIEIVRHPDKRWSFYVEKNNEMIFNSKLGNVYYETPEFAHSAMINSIMEKYERKELAKFCKTKSTKKR